jgi:hypothetical protein
MDAETVLVAPENQFGGFRVTATFTMRNTAANPVTCAVAFPFESKPSASIARGSFKAFVGSESNLSPVTTIELKVRDESVKTPRSVYDFPAALVWNVTWSGRETKLIQISYDMGEPEHYSGFVDGWRLRYIVRTGALWKGPIGKADIILRLDGNPMLGPDFASPGTHYPHLTPPFSYAANATRVSPTEIKWHFENWTPDEDVWLGMIRWVGFGPSQLLHTFIQLPLPYAGAKSDYTDKLLEQLVDRELAPWRESFPEEAKRDRPALKALIAEWLYREMFARHGDSFYLGKRKPGEPAPQGSFGFDENDNYLSIWREKFPLAARGRGGWYKPGTGPGPDGAVRLSDLTPQEQRNAEFLRRSFAN